MQSCIAEYEAIKSKTSQQFKTVKDFCAYHKFSHQNFMKIYHRYKQNSDEYLLLPQKRGPKYQTRRIDLFVENRIIELRKLGNNRQEIASILRAAAMIVSESTVYNIFKRNKLNHLTRLQQPLKQARKIKIMSKINELVHIDLHQLSPGITIAESEQTYYLLGVIDGFSRLAHVEVIDKKGSLDVMFAALKSFNMLRLAYGVEPQAVLSDNGAEFGSGRFAKNKDTHPFERLLSEMGIKHRYTKPYTPKTNGKIERF
jgi:hypothetical protein